MLGVLSVRRRSVGRKGASPMKLSRSLITESVAGMALLLAAVPAHAQVTGTVRWNSPTVSTNAFSYGMNVYDGFDPNIAGSPGDPNYKSNFALLQAGMIRYHYAGNVSVSDGAPNNDSRSWVSNSGSSNYAWDTAKINNAMSGSYSYGPTRMISIANWPTFLDDGTGHLQKTKYAAYASFCAQLVQIMKNNGHGGMYYEVTNELDNSLYGYAQNSSNSFTMKDVGAIINQCITAMKAVDSSIHVGGPAFSRPDVAQNLNDFFVTAGPNIDFTTYHAYDVYDPGNTTTNQQVFNGASSLGSWTNSMRQAFTNNVSGRTIQYFHTEYSVNSAGSYAPNDNRATTIIGAVSDALGMVSMVNAGVTGTMHWNEADYGHFGVLDAGNQWQLRLPGLVYQIFNRDFSGTYVASTSSNSGAVVIQGARGGTYDKICLINRAESSQTVQLTLTLQSGQTPAGNASFTVEQVNPSYNSPPQLAYPGNVTYSTLQSGYVLPANTVTIIQADETGLPTGGGGSLTGSVATVPGSVNLATEGTTDWAHWGLSSSTSNSDHSMDHKSGVNQISDFTVISNGTIAQVPNFGATDSWSGGTPTATSSGTTTSAKAYIPWSYNTGFSITAPADTTTRTLKVYVGVYDSDGQLTATLSDNSAPQYTNTLTATNGYQQNTRVYTLTYKAGSPGQHITVNWTCINNRGSYSFSEAQLQAATLH